MPTRRVIYIPSLLLRSNLALNIIEGTASAPSAADKIGKIYAKNRPKAMAFRFTIYDLLFTIEINYLTFLGALCDLCGW
jgi:hypothetical protein